MINIKNINNSKPYKLFLKTYNKALAADQEFIEAASIASYNKEKNEVESRFVNIKYIEDDEWIFFSNYNSKKAQDFLSHPQITCLIHWHKINTQIRIKAKIFKTAEEISDEHYIKRSINKNALAWSSNQSMPIQSYEEVITKYEAKLNSNDVASKRPPYWGGYSFIPYYFEFWEGDKSRVNKRVILEYQNKVWQKLFLQP